MVGPVQINTIAPTLRSEEQGRPNSANDALNQKIQQRQSQDVPRADLDTGTDVRVEARRLGVTFRAIDNPRVIQARVVDRETEEIVREAPTTERLQFAQKFRQFLAEVIGQRLDFRA